MAKVLRHLIVGVLLLGAANNVHAEQAPFLDEATFKACYRDTSVYAIYNTHDEATYTKTQNPLAAVAGLCIYYGKMPAAATKDRHGKETDGKTRFRLLNKLTREAGLRDENFGKLASWKSKFLRQFKLKDANKDFVEVKNELTFAAEEKHLKAWLAEKQAVLWVRASTGDEQDDDNKRINGGKPFPLTIALIDGWREGGEIHVVWPRGNDRRYKHIQNGWHKPEELFYDVKQSVLIYWRP